MLIALTGPHSSGKTSVLKLLQKEEMFVGYNFITGITRSLIKKGLHINEDGDDNTQLEIMNSHVENIHYRDAIMDRCFLDGVVYTRYLYNKKRVSSDVMLKSERLFQESISTYNYLFYFTPEVPIEDDGVRSTAPQFQLDIVDLFQSYIKKYSIPIIPVKGSIEERKNFILNKVGESK